MVLLTRALLLSALVAAIAGGWLALRAAPPEPATPLRRERGPVAVVEVADSLGAVAAAGDLWMDDRFGDRLLRVDGSTGRVRAAVPVTGRLAIAAGARDVWAVEAGGDYGIGLRGPLLRIDPATARVQARIGLGGTLVFGVLAQGRDVWLWGPSDVLRVDARSGRVVRRIAVGGAHGELRGLALVRRRLVVAAADGRLTRFDARTGRRLGGVSLPLRAPAIRAAVGGRVVLSSRGAVAAVDPVSGRVAWRRRLGFRAGSVVPAGGLLWTHSAARDDAGDRLTALEPATGRVRDSMLLPVFGTTGMAFHRGRLWLPTAGGRAVAVRLPSLRVRAARRASPRRSPRRAAPASRPRPRARACARGAPAGGRRGCAARSGA